MDTTTFNSDGCTGFPDVWRGVDLTQCCNAHDLAWYQSPDVLGWIVSNAQLSICFTQIGVFELAIPAFVAVSTIGAFLYFGGKNYLKTRKKN